MRIAILGIRGVPASYGGFETFAEQFGLRLAQRGHDVTVYGRSAYVDPGVRRYRGMRIVRLPAPRSKYFETVVHSVFAAVDALRRRYDIVYVCNSANVPAALLLRLFGTRVVLNVDGLEWRRAKWNRVGRAYYRLCAFVAAHLPIEIVTDAAVIRDYYRTAYGRETHLFAYGTDGPADDDGTLASLGLEPRAFVLYVSRLEPENNAHVVIEAYRDVETTFPLAIVGDAPYAGDYIAGLKRTTDSRVRFMGAIYGRAYEILQSNAAAYVQATEVGGTHPALVEAMGRGAAIVANDVPEHRETLGDAGRYYSGTAELARELDRVLRDESAAAELRGAAEARARDRFDWDAITDSYEAWFRSLLGDR